MDGESIIALAGLYGSGVDTSRPENYHINCPFGRFHSQGFDSSMGLSVKVAQGKRSVAFCHSCGASGSLSYVFQEATKADPFYGAAAKFVQENDGASLSAALGRLERQRQRGDGVFNEVPKDDWAAYAARCGRFIPQYMVDRGITLEDVRRWRLGFDEELQRAIFPVWNYRKQIVGCLRRAVHEGQDPKYKDTPGADAWKKTTFYGEHRVDPTLRVVYLVEGPMDVIFPSRFLPNVLGFMGSSTGIEGERLHKLRKWADKLVFLLDPDKAGYKALHGYINPKGKLKEGLKAKLRRWFIIKEGQLPSGFDPCDLVRYDPTLLQEIIAKARYLTPDKPLTIETEQATVGRPTLKDYLALRRMQPTKPSQQGVILPQDMGLN